MKSTNENDGQHIFTQSKSQKSNKRMMAGTITGETKSEGQRKAKICTPNFTPVLKATPPVHVQ
jgi:hypothetical protein